MTDIATIARWCETRGYQLTTVFNPASHAYKPWWAAIDETPGLIEDEDDCLATAWGDTMEEAVAAAFEKAQRELEAQDLEGEAA